MNINLMRFIDRRLGIPICFLLSCVHSIRRIFGKPKFLKNPERILFIEMSEMGSIVLAHSLFKKTKELYPDAEHFFLTFTENRYAVDILDTFPRENVVTITTSNVFSFLLSTIVALWKLRFKKISLSLDLELFARFTTIISYLIGARNRVGYFRYYNEGAYRGNFQTHKVAYNPHIHIAHNLLNLIYAAFSPQRDVPLVKKKIEEKDIVFPKLGISEKDKTEILKRLEDQNGNIIHAKKIILFNPNASDRVPLRRWPLEHYIELAKLILEQEGVFIVITGVKSEKKYADIISDAVSSERCLNFAGKTTFSELIKLYHVSDALVTNDSGPVHFSSLTNIKTFAFYGPETPRLYGPLGEDCFVFYSDYACSPCISAFNNRRSACSNNECLKSISPAEVYEEVRKHILQ